MLCPTTPGKIFFKKSQITEVKLFASSQKAKTVEGRSSVVQLSALDRDISGTFPLLPDRDRGGTLLSRPLPVQAKNF